MNILKYNDLYNKCTFFYLDKSHIDEISSNLNTVINDRINNKKIFLKKENENSILPNNI